MQDHILVEFPLEKIVEAQQKEDDALLKKIIQQESIIPFEWHDIARIETWSDMLEGTVCFRLHWK
jgi:hypothetical protein